ncbi:winged helix-turn-helix transcriptional regulator [Nguyenibacter vanlangensis]|uniref:Winged helix-turn-helix transcriptional regulator n=2 Tax=Nguyenibacter vanlangensis TaxID=1216886 RepID=A0A7Y7IV32_9PROT|nr:winged helix-turn-helix transcriptional regulator [Nguyenibacter vanlangensis]
MEDAARSDLDRTDRAILNHLAANGRLPISDLAPLVNQSAATCFRRVQRLVERGVILRFSAILDSAKVRRGALDIVIDYYLGLRNGKAYETGAGDITPASDNGPLAISEFWNQRDSGQDRLFMPGDTGCSPGHIPKKSGWSSGRASCLLRLRYDCQERASHSVSGTGDTRRGAGNHVKTLRSRYQERVRKITLGKSLYIRQIQ